jgi:hypothetical protein
MKKEAKKHYPEYYSIGLGVDRIGFERGYNLAKETLYTEEDMLNAFYQGWEAKNLIWKDAKKQFKESLKQPKKD